MENINVTKMYVKETDHGNFLLQVGRVFGQYHATIQYRSFEKSDEILELPTDLPPGFEEEIPTIAKQISWRALSSGGALQGLIPKDFSDFIGISITDFVELMAHVKRGLAGYASVDRD